MQNRWRYLALSMGLVVAAGCAQPQVSTDYSPSIMFNQFRTFTLVMPPDTSGQQLLDQRIRRAVQAQLVGKGLTETDRENADLYVGYGMVDKTHKEVYSDTDGWGWGRGWGWRYYRWGVAWPMTVRHTIETYTDGTVVVNLVDAKTKQVIWQGEVADVVRLPISNPADATKQVNRAVMDLFEKYPPSTTGA